MTNYKVLSIRQPWAALIVRGIKPVDNRTWRTDYRGIVLIHAAQAYDHDNSDPVIERLYNIDPDALDYGAVIGMAYLADIVTQHRSPFFKGPYGWVFSQPRPVKPVPMRGYVRLFNARLPKPLRPARRQ